MTSDTYLGDYRILSRIGEGGQGSVYLAEGVAGRVALKQVENPRFEVSRLKDVPQHPNLVKFIDIVDQDDINFPEWCRRRDGPFVVMSYVEGTTLTNHREFGEMYAKKLHSDQTRLHGYTTKYAPPEYKKGLFLPSYDIYQLALISFEAMFGDDAYDHDEEEWNRDKMQEHLSVRPSYFHAALADGLKLDPRTRPKSIWEWITTMVDVSPPAEIDQSEGFTTRFLQEIFDSSKSQASFKESTGKISVTQLCAEIEDEFDLPKGSLALCRLDGKVAKGNTQLETLTTEQFPHDWDYGEATLKGIAIEIGARFGLREEQIAFRQYRGTNNDLYNRKTQVKTLRGDYPQRRRSV